MTTGTEHTPGPWPINPDAERHEPGFYGTPSEPGEEEVYTAIRVGESGVHLTGYMKPADANLIAAAPDLLATAKALWLQVGDWKLTEIQALGLETTVEMARAAIAKAEGQS